MPTGCFPGGAEADQAAIKLARKYGHDNLKGKYEILTMKGSFHGRTLAAITATGQEKFHVGFSPLPEGFRYIPFNDVQCLEKAISREPSACSNPSRARAASTSPRRLAARRARALRRSAVLLLILDEVQTGHGPHRASGSATSTTGVAPDIMTLAKALGGGVAIGAMVATRELAAASSVRAPTPPPSAATRWPAAAIAALETIAEGTWRTRG